MLLAADCRRWIEVVRTFPQVTGGSLEPLGRISKGDDNHWVKSRNSLPICAKTAGQFTLELAILLQGNFCLPPAQAAAAYRRIDACRVGLVLAGLGTCLIVFAVLMPTWVSSKVLKFPLNEYATATLAGSNASYFSPAKLTEVTGVNMEATYTIKGNAAAGSSSTAVWNQFIYVYDLTNKQPVQTMTRTMAFDRRTAQLIDCCGANVNGDSSIEQTGIVGYVFPIGTQQQTYDVFDTNLNKPMPFDYSGTDTVHGIQAYRFVQVVSPTQNGTQVVPGSVVGQSQASVVLPQYYEMRLTYWIDPDTGALLNATEHETLTLR